MLDRLDLDTEKPSDEELAKKFGYEEDYYKGATYVLFITSTIITILVTECGCSVSILRSFLHLEFAGEFQHRAYF